MATQKEAARAAAARRVEALPGEGEMLRALGEAIRRAARAKRLSQRDIATLIGSNQRSVCEWMLGRYPMGLGALVRLAAALDLSPAALLGWSEAISEEGEREREWESRLGDVEGRLAVLEGRRGRWSKAAAPNQGQEAR